MKSYLKQVPSVPGPWMTCVYRQDKDLSSVDRDGHSSGNEVDGEKVKTDDIGSVSKEPRQLTPQDVTRLHTLASGAFAMVSDNVINNIMTMKGKTIIGGLQA